jgi:hypothetical protein
MCAALQGQNPARDERAHYIIEADVGGLVELLYGPEYPVSFHMALPGVESPIGSRGGTGNICRQVDEIIGAGIPNIKESLLPGSAGFQAGELIEGAPLAGRKYARPTLYNGLGERKLGVFDRVDPEVIKMGEGFDGRPEADETFHEGNIRRKVKMALPGRWWG